MDAAKMRVWNRVHFLKPFGRQVALGTFGFASKHFAIESNEPFPVSGNQICMHVFCADWHWFVLDKFHKYHKPSAHVILSEAKLQRSPESFRGEARLSISDF
jgi:hypothetical protein